MMSPRGVCVLIVALIVLGCSSPEEKVAKHLERGRAYTAEGAYREATIELRAALGIDPNRADVHFELAEAYRALGQEGKAFWELQETVRLDPGHHRAKVYYAQTLALSSQLAVREQALAMAEEAVAEQPDSVPAKLAEGRALHALGRGEEARDAVARAVAIDGQNGEARRLLGWLNDRLGDRAAAEREYRAAIEADGSFMSWISLAQHFAWPGGRDDEAAKAYEKAIEIAGHRDAMRGIEGYAGFLLSRGQIEESGALINKEYEGRGQPPELLALLVRFHSRVGRDDQAESIVRTAAEASTDDPGPYVTLSAYLEQQGDFEGAAVAIEEALRIDPNDPDARLREAFLMATRGKRDRLPKQAERGRALLAVLIESEPPNLGRALVARGRLELDDGDHVSAAESLRLGIGLGVDDTSAHALHGAALVRADPWRAVSVLRRALERDLSSVQVRTLLVDALNRVDEHTQALEVGVPVLAVAPSLVELRIGLVDSLSGLGRYDEAVELIGAAPEPTPDLLLVLTRLQLQRGDLPAAREAITRANALESNSPRVLSTWLELDVKERRTAESVKRLERASIISPGNGEIAWLSARAFVAAGNLEKAQEELRRSIRLSPDHLPAYLDLAMMLTRQGRIEEVIEVYEQAVAQQPEASLHFLLGVLNEQRRRMEEAIAHYASAIELDGSMAVAKNNLAYVLAEQKRDLGYALELARAAKQAQPDDPGVADTLGWVHYQRGSFGPAVAYLRESVAGYEAGDPARSVVRYHLTLAEEANGEPEAAARSARAALEDVELLKIPADRRPPSWVLDLRAAAARLGAG